MKYGSMILFAVFILQMYATKYSAYFNRDGFSKIVRYLDIAVKCLELATYAIDTYRNNSSSNNAVCHYQNLM